MPVPRAMSEGTGSEGGTQPRIWGFSLPRRLTASLTTFQTVIGLLTGVVSIVGAVTTASDYLRPAKKKGEVVAVVLEAKTEKAIPKATVEILTMQDAVVNTVALDPAGKARYALDEGEYRVRVTHPRYRAETQQVHVRRGETAEVRVSLRAAAHPATGESAPPQDRAERAIKESVGAIRRLFRE